LCKKEVTAEAISAAIEINRNAEAAGISHANENIIPEQVLAENAAANTIEGRE